MPVTTTNYGLTKPDHGQSGWDTLANANYDLIDTTIHNLAVKNPVATRTTPYSSTPNFDLSLGKVQYIALTGPVTSSTASGAVDGQTYCFIIYQTVGNEPFIWPTNFVGAGTIDVSTGNVVVGSYSVQCFAYVAALNLFIFTTALTTV